MTLPHVDFKKIQNSTAPRIGSVQIMYEFEDRGKTYLLAEAPDKGSVFDVGTIFEVPGSGRARNTLRHRIYTRLMDARSWEKLDDAAFESCFSDRTEIERLQSSSTFSSLVNKGARTHHIGLVDRSSGNVVQGDTEVSSDLVVMEKYPVIFPKREVVAGLPVYDYSEYREATVKLVALEHIVRRGNPGGSSLQSRYEKLARISQSEADAFLATFGTQGPLEPWSLLPNLAVEWSTKFEGYDRYLSTQEALLIAGVNAATLNRVVDLLMLATVQVNDFVSSTSLELWDLKWELAVQTDGSSEDRDIVIVDTIDHDSMRLALRLTHELIGPSIVHFNKQAVRDYYKIFHRDWWASLDEIKELSNLPGADSFKDILWNGIKEGRYPQPPGLEDDFADLQGRKYELVTAGPAADPSMGQALALEEISYYSKRGRLEEFRRFNALS